MKDLICVIMVLLVGLCGPDRSCCDDGSSPCSREARGSDFVPGFVSTILVGATSIGFSWAVASSTLVIW